MEIEGPSEYVDGHAAMFLSHLRDTSQSRNTLVSGEGNNISTEYQTEDNLTEGPRTNQSPTDLIVLFREKSPTNQRDEVLLITYFYQKHLGRENLTLEDYTEAYASLKRLAIETPSNMKSSVRNVVDRTKLLYNPERGKFALTLQGEQYVETLGGNDNE